MKTTKMKHLSLFGVALCAMLTLSSCKNEPKAEDTKEVAEEQNENTFDRNDDMEDDSEFLVAAAESDLMEIEIGKLAQSRGTHAHVKEMGKMLVDDHTKSSSELKDFAAKLNVTLPAAITEKGREKYSDLNDKKTGADFDKEFADISVKAHKETIDKMEKASEKANNAEIRQWAANKIPTLRAHLEHAEKLQEQLKDAK
jgi:putative membrane protein